ncbi:MAG: hypothetical protein P4M11_07590 [Candidatus Pacebacteria bacterium]|nr:hypothetical protein [Candidatus Paceibacterota bacterium]
MELSNSATAYLLVALSMVLLWGFIASIALETEYRYIGLSISALASALMICHFEFSTFSTTTFHREHVLKSLTVADVFECYKLAACITTDHKDLYQRGKKKQEVNVLQEFKEISLRKSIKLERDLSRRGVCSRVVCGACTKYQERRFREMSEKLAKLQIAETPALTALKDFEQDIFDDLVYTHQMQEFAAFAHTVIADLTGVAE